MVGFEEWFHDKEGVEVETRDGVSGVKNRFLGVDKIGNKWRARASNPLLRTRVHLGHYGTPEEAALVAKKKREEFEEMFERQESSSMGTCKGYFEGKKFHGKVGVEVETRDSVSGVKKHFLGVDKIGNRWRARARDPLLRADVHLGCYGTPEEAALVAKRKREEFQEMLERQESSSMGTCRGYFEGKKFYGKEGVDVETRDGASGVNKRFHGVDPPRADDRTSEEAALVVKKKRAEFEEMFKGQDNSSMGTCRGHFQKKKLHGDVGKKKRAELKEMFKGPDSSSIGTFRGYFEVKKLHGMEGVEVETRDSISGVEKRFLGVEKRGNRWRARVRNPLLRADVHLGYYGTPEEAALAVKKKKAEFEEMFRRKESSSMGICKDYIEGKKLSWGWGVRRKNESNRVHILHPKLKKWVSGGSYRDCEDAAIVPDKKWEEFQEMYRGEVGKLIVMSGDAKVPPVVKRTQSGKWVARIKKPESNDRIWLGTYNTLEEAVSSYN